MSKNTKYGIFTALMLIGLLVIGAVSFAGSTKDSASCTMGQCDAKTTATKDGFQITMSYKDSSAKASAKKTLEEHSATIKQNYPDAKVTIKETKGGYILSATGKSLKQAFGSAHSSMAMGGEGKVGDTSAKADESGCKMMSSHNGTDGSCMMSGDSKAMGGEGKVGSSMDSKSSGKTCPVMNSKTKTKEPTL
jgi:hypothetical protein